MEKRKKWKLWAALFLLGTIFSAGLTITIIYLPYINKHIIRNKYIKYLNNDNEFKNYNINNDELETKIHKELDNKIYKTKNNEMLYTYNSTSFVHYGVYTDYLQYFSLIQDQESIADIHSQIKSLPELSSVSHNKLGDWLILQFLYKNDVDINIINQYLQSYWDPNRKIINMVPYQYLNMHSEKSLYSSNVHTLLHINSAYRLKGYNLSDFFDLKPLVKNVVNNFNFKYPINSAANSSKVRSHVVDGFYYLMYTNMLPENEAKEILMSRKDELIKWHNDLKMHYFPFDDVQTGVVTADKILLYYIMKKFFNIHDMEYYEYIKTNWRYQLSTSPPTWFYYLNLLIEIFGKDFVIKDQQFKNIMKNDYNKDRENNFITSREVENSIQYLTQFYLMFKDNQDVKRDWSEFKKAIDHTYDEIYVSYRTNDNFLDIYAIELYWYIIFYKGYDPQVIEHKKSELQNLFAKLSRRGINGIEWIHLIKVQGYLYEKENTKISVPYLMLYEYSDKKQLIDKKITSIEASMEILFFNKIFNDIDIMTINSLNKKINDLISNDPKIWLNSGEIYAIYLYFVEDFNTYNTEIKVDQTKVKNWLYSYLNNYKHINILGYFYAKQILMLLEKYDKNK